MYTRRILYLEYCRSDIQANRRSEKTLGAAVCYVHNSRGTTVVQRIWITLVMVNSCCRFRAWKMECFGNTVFTWKVFPIAKPNASGSVVTLHGEQLALWQSSDHARANLTLLAFHTHQDAVQYLCLYSKANIVLGYYNSSTAKHTIGTDFNRVCVSPDTSWMSGT